MKAKDKRTGEIVEIIRYSCDGSYTEFLDSKGIVRNLPISYYDNFEVVEEDTINWEQRRYEIAKVMFPYAAQGVNAEPRDWMKGMSYPKASAVLALRYADALIEELRKGKEK